MSNGTAAPMGFRPSRHIDGTPWNGGFSPYLIASGYTTSLFQGDPVTMLSDGTIGIATAGAPMLGVFWGVKYTTSAGAVFPGGLGGFGPPIWPASTVTLGAAPVEAMIIDDPTVQFQIETSTAAGMTLTGINQNYNFVSGTGNSQTGQSAYALNISAVATALGNFKALRMAQAVSGNGFGVAYNVVEGIINNHLLKGGQGTTGI